MKFIDEQIREYESLDVELTKRDDFDEFWADTMEQVRAEPLNINAKAIEYPFLDIEVRDITYDGLDGTKVHAWILLPPQSRERKVPAIVWYHGAGGSRSTPAAYSQWLLMGAAVVVNDFRMQSGATGSNTGFTGAAQIGLFNLGILDKRSCYLYHAYTDALRAVELARTVKEIDQSKICVAGGSQGGATSLFIAALQADVALCMSDVPSNCWLEKRIFDRAGGANSLATFLRERPDKIDDVCETLSYFDNINHAGNIKCPVLVSLGLKDPVCPPENVYAAYNKIKSEKQIVPYPFGEHGGGGMVHNDVKLKFFADKMLF